MYINTIAAMVAAGRASEVQAHMNAEKVDLSTRAHIDARSLHIILLAPRYKIIVCAQLVQIKFWLWNILCN